MKSNVLARLLGALVGGSLLVALAWALADDSQPKPTPPTTSTTTPIASTPTTIGNQPQINVVADTPANPFIVHLSEGNSQSFANTFAVRRAAGRPLTDAEIEAVIGRLPPWNPVPTSTAADTTVDRPAENSTDPTADSSADSATDSSADTSSDASSNASTDSLADSTIGAPADTTSNSTSDSPVVFPEFARPPEPLPRPRSGTTVAAQFPLESEELAPSPEAPPLRVLRVQPEGDVGIAPFVSITFNQPMVPIGTIDFLAAADVPARLTPPLEGRWQWIGTRTLRFEHDPANLDRLPMATSFQVSIPADTRSQAGEELAEPLSFEFATPPPTLLSFVPQHDSLPTLPVFLATFDQRISPQAALEAIALSANGQEVPLRLANEEEYADNDEINQRIANSPAQTWIAFRPVTALEPDTDLTIELGPQFPSAEGPITSSESHRIEARTYQRLSVAHQSCPESEPCQPGEWLRASFNNQLNPATINLEDVEISPVLPGARISAEYDSIIISGNTSANTQYRVTLPPSLGDTFGQTLGQPLTLTFHIGNAEPFFSVPGRRLITLDPFSEAQTFPVLARNHDQLRVRIFEANPSEFGRFRQLGDGSRQVRQRALQEPPWPLISDDVIDTGVVPDQISEVRIDLSEALGGRSGHVIVIVEGTGRFVNLTPESREYWSNQPAVVWVQSTNIGLDVIADDHQAFGWATDLRTGEPLANVRVALEGSRETQATDADGLARFDFLGSREWSLATLGDDQAINSGFLHLNARSDRLIWHSVDDRGIYRPGEEVHLKGWVRVLALSNSTNNGTGNGTNTDTGDGTNTDIASNSASLEFLPQGQLIRYRVDDSFGNELARGNVRLDSHGSFDFAFDIPEGANLGDAWINFEAPQQHNNAWHHHRFQVQEFRRPEFEVSARLATQGPFLVGEPATAAVDAKYFSGGALPNAEVRWDVTTRQSSYSPPNWNDFNFGVWTPWWHYGGMEANFGAFGAPAMELDFAIEADYFYGEPFADAERETFFGLTDSSGSHYLQMDFEGGDNLPTSVRAQAQVTDVNRQQWASSADLLVHSANLYVGIRSAQPFVKAGEGLTIEAIVTNIEGDAIEGRRFEITASRLVSEFINGQWQEVATDPETCEAVSAEVGVECTFEVEISGRYRIDAKVADDLGRVNRSELVRWVSGGANIAPNRNITLETATLVPNAATYAPGEVAEVLVDSPIQSGTGLLMVVKNEVVATSVFEVANYSALLEVPITQEHFPEIALHVEIVGSAPRIADDGSPAPESSSQGPESPAPESQAPELAAPEEEAPMRPAFASGQVSLRVPPVSRSLQVVATPENPQVMPGSSTSVTVEVSDADGAPVENAQVLLVVVDEAVLALSGYELADPLESFYQPFSGYVHAQRARETITLATPEELEPPMSATSNAELASPQPSLVFADSGDDMAAEDGDEASAISGGFAPQALDAQGLRIRIRENLGALAVFEPDLLTDASGLATAEFIIPDSLTRYRIMAIATEGSDKFGSGESSISAGLPLQVRPSLPRFLNFGDHFQLPIVLQNQTDAALEVDVVVQVANLALEGPAGRRVEVPANDRVEVRFGARATSVGTAHFRVAAVAGRHADAQVLALPVYTPATSEAFATYGVLDSGAVSYAIAQPDNVIPQFGGLELNTSSTALHSLTDAVLYLSEYQYESADAYASRILAISALRDVLEAFQSRDLPTPAELDAIVRADIEDLAGLQNENGGFGRWSRLGGSSPYESIQAMHALFVARSAGFGVSREVLSKGLNYLAEMPQQIPSHFSQANRDFLTAYALNVRALGSDRDAASARGLWQRRGDDLQLDALALIWPIVDDPQVEAEIQRVLDNRVVETARSATFTTNYADDEFLILGSDRRTNAMILDSLIEMAPESELIPKVVEGLLGNRVKGRWNNVQENSFILLALGKYFEAFEGANPNFVARAWFGEEHLIEHEFSGRTIDRVSSLIPMEELRETPTSNLVVSHEGVGRLYYRLGLRYAPASFDLDPLDNGFVVQRTYEPVDDESDSWVDSEGIEHVVAGASVRVRVTLVSDRPSTNLVLIDPLPAGFEPVNPELAVSGEVSINAPVGFEIEGAAIPELGALGDVGQVSFFVWFDHQNLRDDRVEAFSSYLPAGTYEYSYIARATTPGVFNAPPARAEEIYAPEVFGRSSSTTVIVEDPPVLS